MAGLDAAFDRLFEIVQLDPLRCQKSVYKGIIFIFGKRTVDVIAFLLLAGAIARGTEGNIHIDRIGMDDRRDRIEKIQVFFAAQRGDGLG